jgi:hypothetical protein
MDIGRGAISSAVKRPGREADHSLPYSADVKNGGALPPLPYLSSCRGAKLIKHREILSYQFQMHCRWTNLPDVSKGVISYEQCVTEMEATDYEVYVLLRDQIHLHDNRKSPLITSIHAETKTIFIFMSLN